MPLTAHTGRKFTVLIYSQQNISIFNSNKQELSQDLGFYMNNCANYDIKLRHSWYFVSSATAPALTFIFKALLCHIFSHQSLTKPATSLFSSTAFSQWKICHHMMSESRVLDVRLREQGEFFSCMSNYRPVMKLYPQELLLYILVSDRS